MMGVPANYLFMAQEPRFADADLVVAAARGRRRRADARGAARHVGGARRRDRPGLRPDRGGAERALPAARGRAPQGRLGRQAVPVRRLRPLATRASCSCAGRTSSPATGATTRRPRAAFRDGWLLTGDVAERDDEGNYRIRGRLKEHGRLRRRERLPGRDRGGAARASRRRRGGGRRRARRALGRGLRRVRRRSRAPVAEDELRAHCRERLARFKVPKTLPRRRRAAAQLDGQGPEGRARAVHA